MDHLKSESDGGLVMGYEYIVVAFAAVLAGVGTGLVGLSAATAMVPLLIVLCPTFGGEHGAYMATAIALASDILGSAVTTWVYAKNKKIDLKHGWLIAVCIIGMCTVGSIAAYFTRQAVLGGFSLFLCVAIGIRFLISPDSKERPEKDGKVKLTFKEIAVSLFFWSYNRFWHRLFWIGRRYDDAYCFHSDARVRTKNSCGNFYLYHDLHRIDCFCQPYSDRTHHYI